ncbi:MAG TPA: hypothetical protein VLF68_02140 [Candidatus Saccharimonadales bacterium]|nr:hypothetical protein [Candidatus Saccharimonadales bacterium]
MNKFLFTIGLTFFAFLLMAVPSFADTTCQPIYGGGQNCVSTGISVVKSVQNPQTGAFVNNLSANDPRFSPSQTVTFQVAVTNNGSAAIGTVTVKDTFPQFVAFKAGPGSFDQNSKVLTFTLTNLAAGETRTVTLTGTTADQNTLPSDQGITCPVNQVSVTADNGKAAQASSQLCIQKQTTPTTPTTTTTTTTTPVVPTTGGLTVFPAPSVTNTPPTGPDMLAFLYLIPSGALGYMLRKRAIPV